MISFHPTTKISNYVKTLFVPSSDGQLNKKLGELFPNHNIILTDSGRSALAVIFETLSLSGKRLLLPSYLCNVLLPILKRYSIQPVFVDIDPATFQPSIDSYTPEILKKCDAVLTVATYGRPVTEETLISLKQMGKIVIEDYAHHLLPIKPYAKLTADARLYSIPKFLSAPDGGLAILPMLDKPRPALLHKPTLTFVKKWLKLFVLTNLLLAWLKHILNLKINPILPWSGVLRPSKTTRKILLSYLGKQRVNLAVRDYTYCHPLRVKDPIRVQRRLLRHGIIAERIWHDPIITHPLVQKWYRVNPSDYPNTIAVAREILCLPLWHIKNKEDLERYSAELQHILPNEFAGFGEQW